MLDPCSMFLPVGVGFTADVPKYAKGVTYSDAPAYLPGFGPGAGAEQKKTNWWAWGLGALAVGGVVWWLSRSGTLLANPFPSAGGVQVRFWSLTGPLKTVSEQHFSSVAEATEAVKRHAESAGFRNVRLVQDEEEFPGEYRWTATTPGGRSGRNVAAGVEDEDEYYQANPTLAADWRAITWEKAYREALREGLKRGEAEEYAGEVLRAEEDDRLNMLGGALDPPEEGGWGKDYAANPSKKDAEQWQKLRADYLAAQDEYEKLDRELSLRYGRDYRREWASRTEQKKLEQLRARRDRIGHRLFVLLQKVSPRDWSSGVPAHWIYSTLSWEDAVRPVSEPLSVTPPLAYGHTTPMRGNPDCARHFHNPGRAQELGFTEADADPHELALGIKHELEHTKSRAVAKRIALDHLAEDGRYYTHLTAMEKRVKAGKSNPAETFEAVAVDSRGRKLGSWRASSMRQAMAAADSSKISAWAVIVRGEYTSDGTHWGVGRGRVVASREPRMIDGRYHQDWIVE